MRPLSYVIGLVILLLWTLTSFAAEWSSTIAFTNEEEPEMPPQLLTFGINDGASDGYDSMDILAPPLPPSPVHLHVVFNISDPIFSTLSKDIKTEADTIEWQLDICSDTGSTILTWDVSGIAGDRNFILDNGEIVNMRIQNSLSLALGRHYLTLSVTNANTPPVASDLSIDPPDPVDSENLLANCVYYDADGDPMLALRTKWYKDGVFHKNGRLVYAYETSIGETWHFTVRPTDGKDDGDLQTSPSVIIASNNPPVASDLSIEPPDPLDSDDLLANCVYYDADGDPMVALRTKWYRNGMFHKNGRLVYSFETFPGETWYFTVRPTDGKDDGDLQTSPSVIIGE